MSTQQTAYSAYTKIASLISQYRFTDPIAFLSEECRKAGRMELLSKIKSISDNYSYLRRYAISGVSDPSREKQLEKIKLELLHTIDSLVRYTQAKSSSDEYYSTLRFEATRHEESIKYFVERIINATSPEESFSLADRLFKRTWVTFPLHEESASALKKLFEDITVDPNIKCLIVSAIFLGTLQFFDPQRINLLLEIYASNAGNNISIAIRAVTAAIIAMLRYGKRASYDSYNHDIVDRCNELPTWNNDFSTAYLCIVHTLDTPRINSKIMDELVPGIMKLKPQIGQDMSAFEKNIDFEDLEENPQWAELLEKNGLAEQMRQMAEIQQEGGDVFMITFSKLKGFPFFNSITNWFVPFTLSHPALKNLATDDICKKLLGAIASGASFLCNSDKYSLALSLGQMPVSQRNILASQISLANEAQSEENSTSLLPDDDIRKRAIRSYVQDLYRFFNIYSRKDEFINPFEAELDITSTPLLKEQLKPTSDIVCTAAEFCFAHKHYSLALKLFAYMLDGGVFNQELLQKTGFCHQALNNIPEALESYRKAELLDGDNPWTLRKIASCLAITGNHTEALEYYKRLFDINKEDPSAIRLYLMAAIATGNTSLSKDLLTRLEYYSPSPKNLKIASMTEQIAGNTDEAYKLMGRYISEGSKFAKPNDYLVHSLLAVMTGNYSEALDSLSVARESEEWSHRTFEDFYQNFNAVVETTLKRMNMETRIPEQMLNLIFDSLPRI